MYLTKHFVLASNFVRGIRCIFICSWYCRRNNIVGIFVKPWRILCQCFKMILVFLNDVYDIDQTVRLCTSILRPFKPPPANWCSQGGCHSSIIMQRLILSFIKNSNQNQFNGFPKTKFNIHTHTKYKYARTTLKILIKSTKSHCLTQQIRGTWSWTTKDLIHNLPAKQTRGRLCWSLNTGSIRL